MNIFVLNRDPRQAAADHCDIHVPKMIVESAQMLSTAHHALDGDAWGTNTNAPGVPEGIYKKAHLNHPCSIWVRESRQNYEWLWNLATGLVEEYHLRYGNKTHKTEQVLEILKTPPKNIVPWGLTYFAKAMPDVYKHEDAVVAYRNFYMGEKRPFAKWRIATPEWWVD